MITIQFNIQNRGCVVMKFWKGKLIWNSPWVNVLTLGGRRKSDKVNPS